jgi:hypothetical protein
VNFKNTERVRRFDANVAFSQELKSPSLAQNEVGEFAN